VTRLRRIEPADIEVIESQASSRDIAGEQSWFGFRDAGFLRNPFEAGELITPDGGWLAVTDDDDAVIGDLQWNKALNGPPPHGECWNLGIWIVPEHRGKGHGSRAQQLGAAYLFEHTRMERIQAGTEADNVAEQRALERAGFTREAVLRRACFRGGEWRDMVLFSKLRGER
jgi:RimJ/RimL family protein N-acetyltransferase